ncbi:MAG: TrbI/VirB10 family protein [Alphaproteobacteria bacterium]|nr:TrbI/VirB10 family protein [Rickettsiales bacterium]
MRAIRANSSEDENNLQELDSLDLEEEGKDDSALSDASSKTRIKTIVSSKSITFVGMFIVVVWMIYSSFFAQDKNINNNDTHVDSVQNEDIELSRRDVKKRGNSSIVSKDEDADNPFRQIAERSSSIFGNGYDLDDPDLPLLDLTKDMSYLNPVAPEMQVDEHGNMVQNKEEAAVEEQNKQRERMDQIGAVAIISPPKWINLLNKNTQYNPLDTSEKYDPTTQILYKDDKKYLISIPVESPDVNVSSGGVKRSAGELTSIKDEDRGLINATLSSGTNKSNVAINGSVNGNITDERKLSMFIMEGSPPRSGYKNKKSKQDFLIIDDSLVSERKSESSRDSTKKLTHLDTSILTGKIIDAVIETAINTEVPGNSRAIVSHDVYGEVGNKVLIPKGSRLYGTYSSSVVRGQSNINISWNRIVRPDGVDVTISAQAVDQFGRAGVRGDVDNRVGDSVANSILMTMTTLGAGLLAQQLGTGAGQSQVVNPNGTFTTTNITPLNYAAQAAIQTATEMVSSLTQGSATMTPIITLPHGTRIKIVLDQDIRLPKFRKVTLP